MLTKNEITTIFIFNSYIELTWIKQDIIKVHKKIEFELGVYDGKIFNPTLLKKYIMDFLKKYKLKDSFIAIAIPDICYNRFEALFQYKLLAINAKLNLVKLTSLGICKNNYLKLFSLVQNEFYHSNTTQEATRNNQLV